jgi:D-glycero-D-manno-heptose 1,7-bisphosphate phosphatase
MLDLKAINKNWTLFLDRDGVINHEKYDDYIYNFEEFKFYDGILEAMKAFAERFGLIVIATNQRGVGKGLMTEDDLKDIHRKMVARIVAAGGRIDQIYYSTALTNDDPNRKPHPGMAFQARAEFPSINFSESVMIGNNISDMEFGRNAGMYTVFLKTTNPNQGIPYPAIDMAFDSLADFAKALQDS